MQGSFGGRHALMVEWHVKRPFREALQGNRRIETLKRVSIIFPAPRQSGLRRTSNQVLPALDQPARLALGGRL